MEEWEIRSERPGTFDVIHNRRPVKLDCDSLDEAMEVARRRGATEAVVVEDDGYRTTHRL